MAHRVLDLLLLELQKYLCELPLLAVCRLSVRRAAFGRFLRWRTRRLSVLYNRSLHSGARAFGYEHAICRALAEPVRCREILKGVLDLWQGAPTCPSDMSSSDSEDA